MPVRSLSLAMLACLSLHAAAVAHTPAGYSQIATGTVPAIQPPAGSYERVSGRSNPALSFYGGSAALAYSARPPRPAPPPRPVNVVPPGKPFSAVRQASAITPYLGLDAGRESESSLPNYFLYVKPQLDQQRMNQVQQAEYRKLQQQVRTAATPGVVTSPNGGIPTTGHSSQFMNNGGYYPTLRR
jgi:hypothetical protein